MPCQGGGDAGVTLMQRRKSGVPLDLDATVPQISQQDGLVAVLGQDEEVRMRADGLAHVAQHCTRHVAPLHPDARGVYLPAFLVRLFTQAELIIELQRAGLDRDGAGLLRRARLAVDDPHPDSAAGQPAGEHQSRGTGADNQHLGDGAFRNT